MSRPPEESDKPDRFSEIADTLRDFLQRIEDGRLRLKEAKPIIDAFNATKERADAVDRKLNELAALPIPQDEELRRQQAEDLERQNLEKHSLDKELSERWHMQEKATEFISVFADDINLFAQRLPLTGDWPKFAEAIAGLRIRRIDAWQEHSRVVNPDLETLKLRLKEMLSRVEDASREQTPLSERDEKIRRTVTQALGNDAFQRHTNPEIIREVLRSTRRELRQPDLTEQELRASLIRIRKARNYPTSEAIKKQRRSPST